MNTITIVRNKELYPYPWKKVFINGVELNGDYSMMSAILSTPYPENHGRLRINKSALSKNVVRKFINIMTESYDKTQYIITGTILSLSEEEYERELIKREFKEKINK